MGNAVIEMGGNGGIDPDALTASQVDVLEGKIAGVRGNDEPVNGAMPNLTASTPIHHSSSNGTCVLTTDSKYFSVNTDGVRRLQIRYMGTPGYISGNTLFGFPCQTKTVTPTASASTVVADDNKALESVVVNAIPNQHSAHTEALSIVSGGSTVYIRIPNGTYLQNTVIGYPEITVSYSTMASVLGITADKIRAGYSILDVAGNAWIVWTGDATAYDAIVLSGYTYWLNGIKRTGTMPNHKGARTKCGNVWWNKDGDGNLAIAVDLGYYECYWDGNSYEYIEGNTLRNALGINAANIRKGVSMAGVVGTMPDYSYLAQGQTAF